MLELVMIAVGADVNPSGFLDRAYDISAVHAYKLHTHACV
jgi:hypothetical protein